MQLVRLRQAVAILGRGGAYPAAAKVLQQLALAGHGASLSSQALRAAWQSAALTQLEDDPVDRVQSLVVLGATLLSSGAPRAAVTAGELAHEEAMHIEGDARQLALGLAALAEGMARRARGERQMAALLLHEARERLVLARHAEGTAIALTELGLLDHEDGAPERALVCFAFAREFLRIAGDRPGAARLALASSGVMLQARRWTDAVTLARDGIADAQDPGDPMIAAQLAAIVADCLWRSGAPQAEIDDATEAAATSLERIARAGPEVRLLEIEARVRIAARRGRDDDAIRQLDAAFDLGMTALDEPTLIELLDWTVSHLVAGSLPAAGWALVERLVPELRARGWARLADLARVALTRLREP